ncbi:MAG: CHASE4 domain-containing protein, partial [Pseudomonadales bacterium]
MQLSTKTLLLLLFITILSFSSAVYVQQAYVVPALLELEAKADRKDVERVIIGFDMVRNLLNTLAYDYAIRDDTYHYISNRDKSYLTETFPIETFVSNDFDVALLADRQGTIIWSVNANLTEETFFPLGFFDTTELIPYIADASIAYPGAPISISGIVNTSLGPMIFASYSVLKSDESGESPGSLLFGRQIDSYIAEEVADVVKIKFTTSPLTQSEAQHLKDKTLLQQYRNDNNIHWYLTDIYEQPILNISLQLGERAFGDTVISKPVMAALGIIIISWLIIILTLNRELVQPILKIGKHLLHIRRTGDYSVRLNSHRNDEVGTLSNECDLLIEYIEKQQEIVEQQSLELRRLSFEDGLTKLANRRRFDQLLNDYWTLGSRD